MELTAITPFALWLNTFFEGYDYAILDFLNTLAVNAGGILTPITKVVSFLGEKGIIFYALTVILILFPKTRKIGVCVFGAVCCGALISNIILKDLVARARPFEASAVFRSFWDTVGSPAEKGFSFPSGHVTSAAAGMFALWFSKGKKFALPTILWVALMMFSRNYLMVHYPSDVLAALLIGIFSAAVAWLITIGIFNWLDDNDDIPFCNFALNFALPFKAVSAGELKEKATDSFKAVKDKASSVSLGDAARVRTALKHSAEAPVKEDKNWNSRWDNYKKNKAPTESPEEVDVKVFKGTVKKPDEPVEAPEKKSDADRYAVRNTVKASAGDFDELDEIKALLNSDTFSDDEPVITPRRRTGFSDGEYRGRH